MGNLTTTPDLLSGGTRSARSRMLRDEDNSAWSALASQETFSSQSHSPLDSDSRPIFTIDPLAFKRDRTSSAVSFVVHTAIIALVLWLAVRVHSAVIMPPEAMVTHVDFKLYAPPPVVMPIAKVAGGGGGGGAHQIIEPTKGRMPEVAKVQFLPPQIARLERPKPRVEPTEMGKIPDSDHMPNLGVWQSPQIALASQGHGSGSGFGQGLGGGIGAGHGTGAGTGTGGGYGGGIMSVGGGVSAPVVVHATEPEFTEAARQANYQDRKSTRLNSSHLGISYAVF